MVSWLDLAGFHPIFETNQIFDKKARLRQAAYGGRKLRRLYYVLNSWLVNNISLCIMHCQTKVDERWILNVKSQQILKGMDLYKWLDRQIIKRNEKLRVVAANNHWTAVKISESLSSSNNFHQNHKETIALARYIPKPQRLSLAPQLLTRALFGRWFVMGLGSIW